MKIFYASLFLTLSNLFSNQIYAQGVYISSTPASISAPRSVTTFAGSGTIGSFNATGVVASFNYPGGITIDTAGNLYIGDGNNNKIRKITPTGVVTTFAGSGAAGSNNATGTAASFWSPQGLVADIAGNIYVADAGNQRIRKITPAGVVTTFAGSTTGFLDGTGIAAKFSTPTGLAIDSSGNIYVADRGNNRIRKITPAGVVTTLAGSGAATSIDGTGTSASFYSPYGICVQASTGLIFVAELNGHKIRKITPAGVVTTLAGSGTLASIDGTGITASFYSPRGICIDASGDLYIAEGLHKIRRVSSTGVVTTVAGSGTAGAADGIGIAANFNVPQALVVDGIGNLFVADSYNHKIRKIAKNNIMDTVTVCNGANVTLSAYGAVSYSWSGPQTISNNTAFAVTTSGAYTVTGTFASGSTNTKNIYVSVIPNPTISITTSPSTTTGIGIDTVFVCNGSNATLTAGGANTYLWSGPQLITNGGTFVPIVNGTYTVTGTNTFGCTNTKSIYISINPIPNVSILTSPSSTVGAGGAVSTFAGTGSIGSTDATGIAASFNYPTGIAMDASGNFYIGDGNNHKIRKITPTGTVTTLAGSGAAGSTNATGAAATFNSPQGLVADASGNIYLADANNHRIRKITPAGVVTTFAGSTQGFTDGTGVAARFNTPHAVAIDSSGNIYVADRNNHRIRKITPAGAVTTLAGSGVAGSANATGTAASFNLPYGICVEASTGIVYVSDYNNHKIRKITPAGVVTTLAGSGTAGSANGNGTAASFNLPIGITLDTAGNLYVADAGNNKIRKITSAGDVTTIAGSGTASGIDGTGIYATFNYPNQLVAAANGNLFIADFSNHKIRKIAPFAIDTVKVCPSANVTLSGSGAISYNWSGPQSISDATAFSAKLSGIYTITATGSNTCTNTKSVFVQLSALPTITISGTPALTAGTTTTSTIAGTGVFGANNGPGGTATFYAPKAIVFDPAGNAYIADGGNNLIRKIDTNGIVSTFAGTGVVGSANGPAASATFSAPHAIAIDLLGNLYVADRNNHMIRKISTSGIVSTLAGSGSAGSANGPGASANFNLPSGLAVDASNNVYVVDALNQKIRKIDNAGNVTTFAGSGAIGSADGAAASATFRYPNGISIDANGNLFVADVENHKIRKITPAGIVSTFAGTGSIGSTNGPGASASFYYPQGVANDAAGNLFVSDYNNYKIRKIDLAGNVTTYFGTGTQGSADGPIASAQFHSPIGIGLDAIGKVYIVEQGTHKIRKISSSMDSLKTCIGSLATLTGNGASSYNWSGPQTITNNVAFAAISSGIYTVTGISALACANTKSVYLKTNPVKSSSFKVSICANQSYIWNGISQNTTGSYLDTFTTASCDSIVTLNLTVKSISTSSFSITKCDGQSYTWNGIAQTTSGSYNDTFSNYLGCDSIVTLNLTVNPTNATSFNDTITFFQTYLWNGVNLNTSGSFKDTFVSFNGCDSIVTLNLTKKPFVMRSATGDYKKTSGCINLSGSNWIDILDTNGDYIFSINPEGNNLGPTCWGVRILNGAIRTDSIYNSADGLKYKSLFLNRNLFINPTNQPAAGTKVSVRMYIKSSEWSKLNDSASNYGSSLNAYSLKIHRYHQATMTDSLTPFTNYNSGDSSHFLAISSAVTISGDKAIEFRTDHFSQLNPIFIPNVNPSLLPVELLHFNAKQIKDQVELTWTTASEKNSSHFEIERSTDGIEFKSIGSVKSMQNSIETIHYRFLDEQIPNYSTTLYYRLKMVDLDARYEYSNIKTVVLKSNQRVTIQSISPNPFRDKIELNISSTENTSIRVKLTDLKGATIKEQSMTIDKGLQIQTIEVSNLLDGIYLLKIIDKETESNYKLLKLE